MTPEQLNKQIENLKDKIKSSETKIKEYKNKIQELKKQKADQEKNRPKNKQNGGSSYQQCLDYCKKPYKCEVAKRGEHEDRLAKASNGHRQYECIHPQTGKSMFEDDD